MVKRVLIIWNNAGHKLSINFDTPEANRVKSYHYI